jgi:hypothetical protein
MDRGTMLTHALKFFSQYAVYPFSLEAYVPVAGSASYSRRLTGIGLED